MQRKGKVISVMVLLMFLVIIWLNAGNTENSSLDKKIVVAVLDTGYSGTDGRVIGSSEEYVDGNGHGTKIVELILKNAGSQIKVLPVRIADYTGVATEDAACRGIRYAIDEQVDIIHMSLNMSALEADSELLATMNEAMNAGIAVVVSAGNNGKSTEHIFPANLPGAIVVSAVDEENKFCSYSNYGNTVDFAAYGECDGESGTSYAAARVTAMLAEEYSNGGDVSTLQEKAMDAGALGKDNYYGYGIIVTPEQIMTAKKGTAYFGRTQNDIGYELLDIDWRQTDAEVLDNYFIETHRAYVGMYLSRMEPEELSQLKEKAEILNSNVLVQDFVYDEVSKAYVENTAYEENFVDNAIKEYQKHEEQLTISAEWLILKNYAYFAISSNDRNDIFYFQIEGFSYTTNKPDSPWYNMFSPEKLKATRTIVKQTTDFGAVNVAGFAAYLNSTNSFAVQYTDPNSNEEIVEDRFYAIDADTDSGTINYGLSIIIEGYSNEKEGYHTGEADIVLMPYDYVHAREEYSYGEYKEPLRYIFSYYVSSTNSTEYASTPQRVEVQQKNFKKLINTEQTIWYNGVYKKGYDYSDVDETLSLEEKLSKYLKSYLQKTVSNVNVYSSESSLHATGFTINAALNASLGIQWNNGETSTIAIQNDIPEYNFPLIINTYEIAYDGNGATGGGMPNMTLTYNEEKELEENQYSRAGYLFRGWATSPDGDVEYADKQQVCNLTLNHDELITLYAVWDEYPWIIAEDLYYSLEAAQSGLITYEELMRHGRAEDREAGGVILPGIDEEKGTSFVILDYAATDYTDLLQEDSIPEIFQVIDSVGNVFEMQIMVHIIDTSPQLEVPKGTTRFINETYYLAAYESGGLEENSIWKINSEYVAAIQKAFANSKNDTPVYRFYFSYEERVEMKEFSQSNDDLQLFYERFLVYQLENEAY